MLNAIPGHGGAYIPPKNTTQNILSKTDYSGSLENSIFKYKDKGNIVIMGNLNARTGIKHHTLWLDNHISPYKLKTRWKLMLLWW